MAADAKPRRDIVLVVDDSPQTLRLLTDAIDATGAMVLVALGGEEALELVEQITPDVVLLDAVMPGIDGFETCRRLKRTAAADVPVIFMTGLTEPEHIVEGFAAGGIDYVTKPIAIDAMLARIRAHLATARAAISARAALDTTGRHLLAVDAAGRIGWTTPQAGRLIAGLLEETDDGAGLLPAAARAWLAGQIAGTEADAIDLTLPDGPKLSLSFVGRVGGGEILLRLSGDDGDGRIFLLKEQFLLTNREAEVLFWIMNGKANRDIGDILGLSPRTVNKHLEGIYQKLGVESRSAAAVAALRALGGD